MSVVSGTCRRAAVRVGVDLILLHEAADGGDLGDAGYGLQVVAKVPVLEASEICEGLTSRAVDERVLVDPPTLSHRADLGSDALGRRGRILLRYSRTRERPSRDRCRPRR
jgi:hypothetical protein